MLETTGGSQYVKPKIKRLFISEGTERNADRRELEDFYYPAIYDVLRGPGPHTDKMVHLKRLNAQLVRLSSSHRQRLLVDSAGHDLIAGEHPSLHHLLRNRKRKENRLIRQVVDDNDEQQRTSMTILRAFAAHFRQAFQSIESQDQCVEQLLECGLLSIPSEFIDSLIHPLTLDELWKTVAQGKPRKAPGTDGICLEFYRAAWDVIKDDLFRS
jgi:hypothetical protein